jgi:uncharacterized phage infection (PIP) family protein YhgE
MVKRITPANRNVASTDDFIREAYTTEGAASALRCDIAHRACLAMAANETGYICTDKTVGTVAEHVYGLKPGASKASDSWASQVSKLKQALVVARIWPAFGGVAVVADAAEAANNDYNTFVSALRKIKANCDATSDKPDAEQIGKWLAEKAPTTVKSLADKGEKLFDNLKEIAEQAKDARLVKALELVHEWRQSAGATTAEQARALEVEKRAREDADAIAKVRALAKAA